VFEENTDSISRKLKILIQISYFLSIWREITSSFTDAEKILN